MLFLFLWGLHLSVLMHKTISHQQLHILCLEKISSSGRLKRMFQASIPNKGTQSAVRTRVLDAMSRRKWVILKRTLLANVISGHVMTDVLFIFVFLFTNFICGGKFVHNKRPLLNFIFYSQLLIALPMCLFLKAACALEPRNEIQVPLPKPKYKHQVSFSHSFSASF